MHQTQVIMPNPPFLKEKDMGLDKHGRRYIKIVSKDNDIKSGFIDDYYKKTYPDKHRWDYLLQDNTLFQVYFAEVHEATSSGCSEVMAKYDWLLDMITHDGSDLFAYNKVKDKTYWWIRPGKNKLNPNQAAVKRYKSSRKYRQIRLVIKLDV
jgi:hypothetical protein